MDIAAFVADWAEIIKRIKKDPELAYSLGEFTCDGKKKWIQELDWFPPSCNLYFGCAEVWEHIRGAKDNLCNHSHPGPWPNQPRARVKAGCGVKDSVAPE